jgi:hypothetical protein
MKTVALVTTPGLGRALSQSEDDGGSPQQTGAIFGGYLG